MTVRFYSSADAGAPVLRGATPGDLINLLDKCLVTGYGSKTAAGWTKPYTGTNIAAFRQGAGSNNMYLRVDDTPTATGTAIRSARVVGYESMSDVNTGAPISFPTPVQVSGGAHWVTNCAGGVHADARVWYVVADESFFWIRWLNYPSQGESQNGYYETYCFGDIIPLKPGDAAHTVLLCKTTQMANTFHSDPWSGQAMNGGVSGNSFGLVAARSFTQAGGPIWLGWHTDHVKGSSSFGTGNLSYPHSPDGALYLAPVWAHEYHIAPYNVRGIMPGLWVPCHSQGILSQHQYFDGQGDLLGKQFMGWRAWSTVVAAEVSDTWDR